MEVTIDERLVTFDYIRRTRPELYDRYNLIVRGYQFGRTCYIDLVRNVIRYGPKEKLVKLLLSESTDGEIYNTCIRWDLDPDNIAKEIRNLAQDLTTEQELNDVGVYLTK